MNFYEISHLGFFLKFVDAFRFWLKSDKKKSKHFTRQPVYTFDISPCFFFMWRCGATRARVFSFLRFLDHTQRRTLQSVGLSWTSDQLVSKTTTWEHTTLTTDRYTCPPAGFETAISAGERP